MKLIVKQRPIIMDNIFSSMMNPQNNKASVVFDIIDERGNKLGFVNKFFDMGSRCYNVYDNNDNMTIQVKRNVMSFQPSCVIEFGEGRIGTLTRAMSFGTLEYETDFGDYKIEGNAFTHMYHVTQRGVTVMEISMELPNFVKRYTLNSDSSMDDDIAVGILLAIDCVNDSKRR